jgi:hypothetical protein
MSYIPEDANDLVELWYVTSLGIDFWGVAVDVSSSLQRKFWKHSSKERKQNTAFIHSKRPRVWCKPWRRAVVQLLVITPLHSIHRKEGPSTKIASYLGLLLVDNFGCLGFFFTGSIVIY